MTDQLDNPFDPFADAVEASLNNFRKEIIGLRGELTNALTEVRSLKSELETRAAPAPTIDVDAIATRAASLIPVPKDGRDGVDGKNGVDGKDGTPGERGADGINGRDGAPGKDGERGADGIATREELDQLVRSAVAEMQVRTFADIYQGVYVRDKDYERGIVTTWDGSLFLSQVNTRATPGESQDWKLIVKRGRDARK